MASAATSRPAGVMTNSVRSPSLKFGGNSDLDSQARTTRFPEFGAAVVRHNSDERVPQSSSLSQTFGNGGTWQPSSGIWGNSAIGSGLATAKRDASRSRVGNDDISDKPTGSGALMASSEADTWGTRANLWNTPDTTSPTLQSSHSGSTSPSHTRGSIPNNSSQTLLDNPYQQTKSAIGQNVGLPRAQLKSSLDPSSGSFSVRKPSFGFTDNEKENLVYQSNGEYFEAGITPTRYLGVGTTSRDGSMPPSRTSEAGLNGNGLGFGGGHLTFGSIGHTPTSSIHSQRQSFSEAPGQYSNGSRFEISQSETALNEKFAKFNLTRHQSNLSQISFTPQGMSNSPSNPNFPQTFTQSPSWNEGQAYSQESYAAGQPFAEQGYFNKGPRFAEKGTTSPAAPDYRRGQISPKYFPGTATPPYAPEQTNRPGSGSRIGQGHPNELDRRMQIQIAQQAYLIQAQAQAQAHFHGQFPPMYDYPLQQFRPTYTQNSISVTPFQSSQVIPSRPAKDQDSGIGIRSALLEEFRSNAKTGKRYELKDIYNHVVEFSGDQHGSRFIQGKLESANSDEKEQIFREIQPNALQLMTDVFGNYVCQKVFEHGNQVQKRIMGDIMKNHVLELSLQMYGCRVVQKAFEHVLADQQADLVKELKADIVRCVKDQNGNHVVQKAVERVPTEHIRFILDVFRGQTHILAVHTYGCRVIQRILEFCKPQDNAFLREEIHACAAACVPDQYGNYVIQHIIEKGQPEDRAKAIKVVQSQLLQYCKHKYASNVVESAIIFGTPEQRTAIVAQLMAVNNQAANQPQSKTNLMLLMADQYGNYVIQTILETLKDDELQKFTETATTQFNEVKKCNYGKQIVAIEKILIYGERPERRKEGRPHRAMRNGFNDSNAATPSLTNGNSPRSSSVPSASASTIDEPTDSVSSGKTAVDGTTKSYPDVVINSA